LTGREEELFVRFWDEDATALVNPVCGPYNHNLAENCSSIPVNHKNEFALVEMEPEQAYFPLILR